MTKALAKWYRGSSLKETITEGKWIELEADARNECRKMITHKERYCPFCNTQSYRTKIKKRERICIKNGHTWLYE